MFIQIITTRHCIIIKYNDTAVVFIALDVFNTSILLKIYSSNGRFSVPIPAVQRKVSADWTLAFGKLLAQTLANGNPIC